MYRHGIPYWAFDTPLMVTDDPVSGGLCYLVLYFFYYLFFFLWMEFTVFLFFFFFQAEDGIRYRTVTGVQTCAIPISVRPRPRSAPRRRRPGAQRPRRRPA